jgi:hypothetical protein
MTTWTGTSSPSPPLSYQGSWPMQPGSCEECIGKGCLSLTITMISSTCARVPADLAQVSAARMCADWGGRSVVRERLELRRLFPGRPASGHPAARAQAFLRARISAVLLSRAMYGMSRA